MMTHFRKRGFPRGSDGTLSQNLNVPKFCPIVSIPESNLERFQRKLGFGDGCWRSFVDDNMLLTSLRCCWPIRDFGGLIEKVTNHQQKSRAKHWSQPPLKDKIAFFFISAIAKYSRISYHFSYHTNIFRAKIYKLMQIIREIKDCAKIEAEL